jgi:RimJ/RimL family protein N-acetyltransferase
LLQFLEFKVEGRIRQGLYLHGAHHDLLQLSILREDYNRDQSINRAGC